ncbi:hypothetical protein [Halomicrococcus sp. NG-SE-24]|uniref:hypothetical protein n=1 Tax=Halomicrococcus sp. NG-SE-24 TaxID=3436928 RepID=UPI003D9588E7
MGVFSTFKATLFDRDGKSDPLYVCTGCGCFFERQRQVCPECGAYTFRRTD